MAMPKRQSSRRSDEYLPALNDPAAIRRDSLSPDKPGQKLNYVYDTNGNVKQNSLSTNFSWNAAGQPITVSGVGATYDALGRLVETNNSGSYTQYIYRPSGDKLGAVSVSNGVA